MSGQSGDRSKRNGSGPSPRRVGSSSRDDRDGSNKRTAPGGKPKRSESGGTPGTRRSSSGRPTGTGRSAPDRKSEREESQTGRRPPKKRDSENRADSKPRQLFDEELMQLGRQERVLPKEVRLELDAFPPRVTDLVGAAYLLIEEDPKEALRYLLEAKRAASRSPSVREACGIAAYHSEDYDTALKELRTARRLSGRDELVPLIADCERALGHPQKALDLATAPLRLQPADQVELRIVAAGARLDLGQPEAAAALLRTPLLDSEDVSEPSARLKYAYAEALLANGDAAAAKGWFQRAAAADPEGITDAVERVADLEG